MILSVRKQRLWVVIFVLTVGFLASLWHYRRPAKNYIGEYLAVSTLNVGRLIGVLMFVRAAVGWTGGDLTGPGPDYGSFREAERMLPQHNLDLPLPEGREGRYVKFSTQVAVLGWNNVFIEL